MFESAGAARFPNRNRAALALIFGMHMLALFAWMRQRPLPLPDAPHVATILLRPSIPQSRPKPPEPVESGYPRPRRTHLPPIQDFFDFPAPAPAKPGAESAAATAAAPLTPAPPAPDPAPSLDEARAPATVQDAIREQKQAEGGFGLNLSKHQAGRIDRELRKGKSGIPDEPDTPMGRFRRGLEASHIDRSNAVFEDSYTSQDGVVTYRKRIGNASYCRRSGSVSPLGMRGMIMGNEAGDVPCPKGVQWKKD